MSTLKQGASGQTVEVFQFSAPTPNSLGSAHLRWQGPPPHLHLPTRLLHNGVEYDVEWLQAPQPLSGGSFEAVAALSDV